MDLPDDHRNIRTGSQIPAENYCDQPYFAKTANGAWLCALTTGAGREGNRGQHVVAVRSTDRGRTWSAPVDIEPADGPEASYSVLLPTPGGRVYCFYMYNSANVREVLASDPPFKDGKCARVDTLGEFVFKFSDDGGRTWSAQRYPVAIREFEIDRENPYEGEIRFGWNVGKPVVHQGAVFIPFHKVGMFGHGFMSRSEGVLLRSDNILNERDPGNVRWKTLPDGDIGLRAPAGGGPIAEEQSFVTLSDGSLYTIYRTLDGYPAAAYSRDEGRTWSAPCYECFHDGRLIKHPRAACFVWKCSNGKYLLWFHNHGGRFLREAGHHGRFSRPYYDRNPAWLCGGVEVESPRGKIIDWSEPELLLYDDDPYVRISYPDLIEEDGEYFLSETQKTIARIHRLDPELLKGLWGQFEPPRVAERGKVVDVRGRMADLLELPPSPAFPSRHHSFENPAGRDRCASFSLELTVKLDSLEAGQVLADNRTEHGTGFCVHTAAGGAIEILLNDGRSESRWQSDPGLLERGKVHEVAVIVDACPGIITFVVDGRFCDGGEHRQFGWGRFNPNLRGLVGCGRLRIASNLKGAVLGLRVYDRALRTSEAVGNWKSSLEGHVRKLEPAAVQQ